MYRLGSRSARAAIPSAHPVVARVQISLQSWFSPRPYVWLDSCVSAAIAVRSRWFPAISDCSAAGTSRSRADCVFIGRRIVFCAHGQRMSNGPCLRGASTTDVTSPTKAGGRRSVTGFVIALTHTSRNPKRPRSAAQEDRGYGGWARRPSAEAAEAPKDSSSTCETWPKCSRRARLEFSNLRDDVRSTTCMPPIGVTKVSTRAASKS
jgi:hypothetical protein